MSKRLAMLEKLRDSGKADSFATYALAMEYRSQKRPEDALATFEGLRAKDPKYVPQYLMAAQLLTAQNQPDKARDWALAGVAEAEAQGEGKALSELKDLLEELDDE